jgi:hypothetical protein
MSAGGRVRIDMTLADDSLDDEVKPTRFSTTGANAMRVYDALLDGKDNYEADRRARDYLLAIAPALRQLARDSREFLTRTTRFLAERAGITQFLDCGATLPTVENTHQTAQRGNPAARIVYVARDSTVLAHGRALLADGDRSRFAAADFRDPAQVFRHRDVTSCLDVSQPLAVLHVGTMQFVGDLDRAREIMTGYVDLMPAGSYLTLAHVFDPRVGGELGEVVERLQRAFQRSPSTANWFRGHDEIMSLFDGLELLDPGLVTLADWWPDGPRRQPLNPVRRLAVGGLARKPC